MRILDWEDWLRSIEATLSWQTFLVWETKSPAATFQNLRWIFEVNSFLIFHWTIIFNRHLSVSSLPSPTKTRRSLVHFYLLLYQLIWHSLRLEKRVSIFTARVFHSFSTTSKGTETSPSAGVRMEQDALTQFKHSWAIWFARTNNTLSRLMCLFHAY